MCDNDSHTYQYYISYHVLKHRIKISEYHSILYSVFEPNHQQKVKVGNYQEKAQSDRNSHFKNRGGKKKQLI